MQIEDFKRYCNQIRSVKDQMIDIAEKMTLWEELKREDIVFINDDMFAVYVNYDCMVNSMIMRFINELNQLQILPQVDDYIIEYKEEYKYMITFIYANQE